MLLAIESNGLLFFRKISIRSGDKIFATIKFEFSFFQKASIALNKDNWNFVEQGLRNTSQIITDSENKVIVTRNVSTNQQLKNSLFSNSSPLITIRVGENTYNLEKIGNTLKYQWRENSIPIGVDYDLIDLIKSESKIFPRFRGLWKFYATLPENAGQFKVSLLLLGVFELINKTSIARSS